MTQDLKRADPLRDPLRAGAREASTAWGWIVALGACRGVNEIFAGFTLRQVGKQAERLYA